jgi:hypothetical protein
MATAWTKINSFTATSDTTGTTFSSIPGTYTDLLLVSSVRGNENYDYIALSFNGSAADFNSRWIFGQPGTVASGTRSDSNISSTVANSTYPSTIFATNHLYIPNYTNTSFNKCFLWNAGQGNNNPTYDSYNQLGAGQWSQTAAITSITITAGDGGTKRFVAGSTFYLYGIKNS